MSTEMGNTPMSNDRKPDEMFQQQSSELAARLADVLMAGCPRIGIALQAVHKLHAQLLADVMGEWAGARLHAALKDIVREDIRRRSN